MKDRALKEIKHYQKQTGIVFSISAFKRIVGSILRTMFYNIKDENDPRKIHNRMRVTGGAMEAFQELTEQFLVQEFNLAVRYQISAKRFTLQGPDFFAPAKARFESGLGYFYTRNERLDENQGTHQQALLNDKLWDRRWFLERTKEEAEKEAKKNAHRAKKALENSKKAAARRERDKRNAERNALKELAAEAARL